MPERAGSVGPEAVARLAEIGVELDPWQSDVLRDAMGRDRAGKWVADEVVEVVPRQNGKTVILLARALWGALLGGERLVVFSAHQFKTARESFLALKSWCETPALAAYGPVIRTGAGNGARRVSRSRPDPVHRAQPHQRSRVLARLRDPRRGL